MLVTIDGKEEEIGPLNVEEDPDGTYIQKESGVITQYTSDADDDLEPRNLIKERTSFKLNAGLRTNFVTLL